MRSGLAKVPILTQGFFFFFCSLDLPSVPARPRRYAACLRQIGREEKGKRNARLKTVARGVGGCVR